MTTPIRVLILEDRAEDAELMLHELRRAGFDVTWERVDTESGFLAELEKHPDLILADYALPRFDSMSALRLLQTRNLDLPFIIVSGTIGEDVAVAAMKECASDYILKDRLGRLGLAVTRALEMKRLRDEKREGERQLRASAERFRALVENVDEVIYAANEQGVITYISPSVEKLTGYVPAELVGRDFASLIHPEDLPNAMRNFVAKLTSQPEPLEYRVLDKRGDIRWVYSHGQPLVKEGRVVSVQGVLSDITERKRAEERLVASELRYRRLFESAKDGIIILDAETGEIMDVNPFLIELLGYPRSEFLGKQLWEFGIFKDLVANQDAFRKLQSEKYIRYENLPLESIDGRTIWVEFVSNVYAVNGEQIIQCNIRDITERKRAELERQKREQRFRALIENSSEGIALLNADGTLGYMSESTQRIMGYTPDEILDQNPLEIVHPDDQAVIANVLGELTAAPGKVITAEYRMKHKDGSWRWIESTINNLLAEPALQGIVFNYRDITASKRSQLEIERRAEEFVALYETAKDVAQQTELPNVLQTVVERATTLLRSNGGALSLYNDQARELEIVATAGFSAPIGTRVKLGESLSGIAAERCEAIIVNDFDNSKYRPPQMPAGLMSASVVVPMLFQAKLIGVLSIHHSRPGQEFSENDASLLTLFASFAASAINNSRLYDETRTHLNQLAAAYDAGLAVNSVLEPRTQLEFLFKIVIRALHGDRAEFFRHEPARAELRFELGVGHTPAALAGVETLVSKRGNENTVVEWVSKYSVPLRLGDVLVDKRWKSFPNDTVRSGIWVPVERENKLLGVLGVLSNTLNAFTPMDERLLVLFANQAAVAMENARLFEATEHQLKRLHALHAIDEAIKGSVDLKVTLNVVLEQAITLLNVDAASVLILNPYLNTLEYVAGRGFHSSDIEREPVQIGQGLAGTVALEQKRMVIPKLSAHLDRAVRLAMLEPEGFETYIGLPLIVKGTVRGVLELFHRAPLDPGSEWLDFLQALAGQAAIAIDNASLFRNLQRSNLELSLAYDGTIEGWSRALDLRDKETEGHTERVSALTLKLARALGVREEELVHIRRGALLHDIGKMGIPDQILLKPGPLTDQEWEIMRRHPIMAYELLSPIAYLRPALDIPYYHHEKWDGTGYPRGLKGELIPLAARIFAVVDVWDALTSDRPYRPAWEEAKALAHIRAESGKHFDPQVVEPFLKLEEAAE